MSKSKSSKNKSKINRKKAYEEKFNNLKNEYIKTCKDYYTKLEEINKIEDLRNKIITKIRYLQEDNKDIITNNLNLFNEEIFNNLDNKSNSNLISSNSNKKDNTIANNDSSDSSSFIDDSE